MGVFLLRIGFYFADYWSFINFLWGSIAWLGAQLCGRLVRGPVAVGIRTCRERYVKLREKKSFFMDYIQLNISVNFLVNVNLFILLIHFSVYETIKIMQEKVLCLWVLWSLVYIWLMLTILLHGAWYLRAYLHVQFLKLMDKTLVYLYTGMWFEPWWGTRPWRICEVYSEANIRYLYSG